MSEERAYNLTVLIEFDTPQTEAHARDLVEAADIEVDELGNNARLDDDGEGVTLVEMIIDEIGFVDPDVDALALRIAAAVWEEHGSYLPVSTVLTCIDGDESIPSQEDYDRYATTKGGQT